VSPGSKRANRQRKSSSTINKLHDDLAWPVATDLPESSPEEATRKNLSEIYKLAIPAASIASAIAYAIEQPAAVEIDEVVIRPAAQDF